MQIINIWQRCHTSNCYPGLLIFLAKFTKICEILPNTCWYNIFDTYIGHWTCFIYLKHPNLSWNFVIAMSKQCPKTTRPALYCKKLSTSHGVIIVVRANNYLCSKNLNSAGQIDFSEICPKKAKKLAVFYPLFLGEICHKNFSRNWPILLQICPKSREIWLFSATYQKPWLPVREPMS